MSPSGLPGATNRPWSRCTSRTTASSASAEDPVQVRQRVLAGGGVEQVRARQVAQAVAQRDQATQRPDVRRRQGDERVGRAQGRGGDVEDEVVRADRDDRALDRRRARAAAGPGPRSPAWWPSTPAGTTSRPSARTSEVSTPAPRAAAAWPRRRRRPARAGPGPSRPMPMRRRQLAGQPSGGRRALARGGTFERGQHRCGEDVEGQRGRDRVAGGAQDRGGRIACDGAQNDRVTGPDGDPVHGERRRRSRPRGRCSRRVRRSNRR